MSSGWKKYITQVRKLPYNTFLRVPKDAVDGLPENCAESHMAFKKGAEKTFRENVPVDSLHIREYADHYTLEVDHYNPHYNLLKHCITDLKKHFGIAAAATLAGIGAYKLVKHRVTQ